MTLTAFSVALGMPGMPNLLPGQTPVTSIIDSARNHIEELSLDSAASLLRRALRPEMAATTAERIRAYLLLGIAVLPQNTPHAREAFHRALVLDPEVRVDSLANLASGLIPVFEAERARLLVLRLEAPSDTRVPVQTGRLQLTARTSHRANVVLSIASGDTVVRHDSQTVAGTAILEWDLRTDDGAVISPGEYVLRINARDSLGEVASAFEARMTIEPATGDTQPLPPPLDPSAFAPESVTVLSHRQPKALVRGLVLGAAAAFLSSVGPSGKDNPDLKAVAVGGALAVVGIVGFFTEGAVTRPLRDNIQRNRELRERDAQGRATIIHANAQTRLAPPLRIRIQGADK